MPKEWQDAWSDWAANIKTAGLQADDPASNMSVMGFQTEGDFGQWIQTTSGLHGALHFKWVRSSNSEHGLGNQFANIDNYMFWKMHGWIDKVWDRYRAAKARRRTTRHQGRGARAVPADGPARDHCKARSGDDQLHYPGAQAVWRVRRHHSPHFREQHQQVHRLPRADRRARQT